MIPLPNAGRCLARLLLVGALVVPTMILVPAYAFSPAKSGCGTGPIAVEELDDHADCDLTGRIVYRGDVALTVPPPGIGVGGSASSTGSTGGDALAIQNQGSHVDVVGTAPQSGTVSARAGQAKKVLPKCSDSAYRLSYGGHPWPGTLAWSYKASSTPSQWRIDEARDAIRRAGRKVARGGNGCGLSDRIDASIEYLGYTTASPSITSTATTTTCGRVNTANVVGWGSLGGSNLGFTCFWWNDEGMIAADMLLKSTAQIVRGIPDRCRSALDLQSLATHEWGHAFGLDHVSQEHANLVMPHLVATCSKSDRTLGLGDYLGLKKLYGTR